VQICAILNELWAIDEIQKAAAAILNLFFCPFWSNGLFPVAAVYTTEYFIHLRQSAAELLLFKRNTRAKFRAKIFNSKQVMSDKWNSKWRPPPSWIYYFCPLWSMGLQPSTSLQNFIHLRQSAVELLLFVQKSKMAAAAISNYNFVMLDHPRSPFKHLKFPFKFCVDRVRTFRDIAIRKFCKFGLKCPFSPINIMFLRSFDPKHYFFIIESPKRPHLTREHAFWAIDGRDRSSGVTCRREQEHKKG